MVNAFCTLLFHRHLFKPFWLIAASINHISNVNGKFVPEELRVSSVRYDVLHNRCRSCNTLLQALLTEWIELQELLALSSPTAVVSSRGSGSCSLRLHLLVFLTVLLPCRDEVRAPRMPAGNHWFVWHRLFTRLLICKRKAPADQADAPQNSFYKIQLA